jgi:MoxR-like ATPase
VLSYEALAREITADHILARVLSTVPAPRIAPSQVDPAQEQTAPPA